MDAFDLISDYEDDQREDNTITPVEITKSTENTSLEKKHLPIKRNFSEIRPEAAESIENSSRKRLLRLYSDESQKSEHSDQDIRKQRRKTQQSPRSVPLKQDAQAYHTALNSQKMSNAEQITTIQTKVQTMQALKQQYLQIQQIISNPSILNPQQQVQLQIQTHSIQQQLIQLQQDPQIQQLQLLQMQQSHPEMQRKCQSLNQRPSHLDANLQQKKSNSTSVRTPGAGQYGSLSTNVRPPNTPGQPKLSAAQIENRKYSIYIKNLTIQSSDKQSSETEKVKSELRKVLEQFGQVTDVSVDGSRKSAIIRFRQIESACKSYKFYREVDPETGKRPFILGPDHRDAQIVYVIPEVSKEDHDLQLAAKRNESYDPCKDKNLTLDQITKLIHDKNQEIQATFKQFCAAQPDSSLKKELEQKLSQSKQRLNEFLQKEREIKKDYSMKKFKRDSPAKVTAPTVTKLHSQKKHFSQQPIEVILSDICPSKYDKIGMLIQMIKTFGEPTDCKFTNESKSEAYIRFKCIYDCENVDQLVDKLQKSSNNLFKAKRK